MSNKAKAVIALLAVLLGGSELVANPNRKAGAQQQDPPLVDVLAELKMIRALQMRVNTRTERYSKLIDGEQAERPELIEALRELAERELRIHEVTRDLEMERNK